MATDEQSIKKLRPSVRKDFSMVVMPFIVVPVLIWATLRIWQDTEIPWWVFAAMVGLGLLVVGWAFFKKLFMRYSIRFDAVEAEEGLLSRRSSEIRIRDIRNITVEQTFAQRLLKIGDVAFSSAAGDKEEVRFTAVSDPKEIKRLVQGLQDKLVHGTVDDGEADVPAAAATPPPKKAKEKAPKPEPKADAPKGDSDAKDELERLLAEQLAEQGEEE